MSMLEQLVREIKEKGWGYQENILTPHDTQDINLYIDSHQSEFVPAMIGKGQSRQRNEMVRGDFTLWIDPLDPPAPVTPLLKILEELKLALNREIFLGAQEYECHLAYYPAGTFYQKHVDRFQNDSSRVLSFVFYLGPEWAPGDGGELVLHGPETQVIAPVPGSLVVFLSDNLPHEVKPCSKERRSFTGWMHSRIIY